MRSAILGFTIALAALLAAAPGAGAKGQESVTLVWLPEGTTVAQIADAGLSPGLLSAGLGSVPAEQTYLDVSQGNRVFNSLYDEPLPVRAGNPDWWAEVVERAESAPAEIVPGLLERTLTEAGRREALQTRSVRVGELPALVEELEGDDLLIAIAKPPPAENRQLAVGVAGRGFDGNLTSDSTRADGYVLSTDVAPTVLDRLGIAIPGEMSGQPIRSEDELDVGEVEALGDRMAVISHRRGPVIGFSLLAWLLTLGLVAAASRGALARPAVRVTALSVVYMPLAMLAGAAIEPGETAEVLLVMLGAPLLAALTLVFLRGFRAIAIAAALTVGAYALDLVLGSPLTSLSLLGPNPGLGVRFYGIGNELEALLAVLVVAGTGTALAGFWPQLRRNRAAIAFLLVGLLAAFVFAAGRFGADVGAAIVFPLGAAVAAVAVAGLGRRRALLAIIAAPFAVLALLALVDLVSGANAHLTRSVLDAGGLGDLSDVAQRRLQLSANSFGRPVLLVFLPVVAILAGLAIWRRDRLREWVRDVPAVRAGLLGALAATAVGTLAN
ncbi:MAG TPA: hypothetical protein VFB52_08375, partial [Solirubrobacterales bacterium]|nr:hypothetical protein [Solirubrobacterales bacterium]